MRREIRTLPLVLGLLLTACSFQNIIANSQPTVSNLNGALTPTGPAGSTVVISGAGFGETQGSGRVTFTPQFGGAGLVPTVVAWTASSIEVIAPNGAPGDYAVAVQSGNGIGSGSRVFTLTAAAPFNASGVTWTAGPALPAALSGVGTAFAQIGSTGFVYAVGGAGAGGAPVNTVYYATVGTTGTIGAWTATTPLPVGLEFAGVVAATALNTSIGTFGFLYVIGGSTSAAGTPVTTIYRAPIANTGILGAWVTGPGIAALPTALRSVGAVIQYGSMYVIGGAGASNAPVATTYRAPIQVDGKLNSWLPQTSLPAGRSRAGIAALGLYLYVVGGESSAIAPNDTGPGTAQSTIYFAKLHPSTRDINTAWTATTPMGNARKAATAVFSAGHVLVTGGVYTGASSHTSESESAAIGVDGTTGTFATAASPTSLNSLCSCNLYNHGALGYTAGNGSFHVLVVGGDDVNAPGTRRTETFTF